MRRTVWSGLRPTRTDVATAPDRLDNGWEGFKLYDALGPVLFGPAVAVLLWPFASPTRLYVAAGVHLLLFFLHVPALLLARNDPKRAMRLQESWAGSSAISVSLMPWIISPEEAATFAIALLFTTVIAFDTVYMSLRNSRWWKHFIAVETVSYALWFGVRSEFILCVSCIAFGFHMLDGQQGIRQMFSSLQEARGRSERLARTDSLTGLNNRRGLTAHLEHLGATTDHALFAVIDVDNFKQINDQFGHVEGDKALVSIADRIVSILGPSWFVARSGGDEFMLVSEHGSVMELQQLKDWLAAHTQPAGVRPVHVSIGASFGPVSEELVSDASEAIHLAKRQGKNQIVTVDSELQERIREERQLAMLLPAALEQDDIDIWVQPILDTENDRVFGYECLARWHQDDGSAIAPDTFIPLLAKLGLTHKMGELAMRRAADFSTRLPLGQKVTVNISASHFLSENFLTFLTRLIKTTAISPSWLILEITESEHLRNAPQSAAVAREVRRRGFGLAVDDFGSGYSSVERLIALPLSPPENRPRPRAELHQQRHPSPAGWCGPLRDKGRSNRHR